MFILNPRPKTMNIINYSGVTKRYNSWPRGNKVRALDDFSLEIEQGEVFGFLGPNGAGKSTALKMLLNFIYPNAGTVSLMGRSVSDRLARALLDIFLRIRIYMIILPLRRSFGSAGGHRAITKFTRGLKCSCAGWGSCPQVTGRSGPIP
jgi:ABC-type glutathione transport system ATPase component